MRQGNSFFISGYLMPPRTEAAFSDLKKSGLTHIYIDYTPDEQKRETALTFCDRFGMKAIVMSCWGRADGPSYKNVIKNAAAHPSFDGVNGLDEPVWEDMEGVEREQAGFAKDCLGKAFYVNMVNRNVPQRFVAQDESISHADLMQRYVALVARMPCRRTVSMTIYPLMRGEDGENMLNPGHLLSLADLAACAQRADADMYFFVQAMPFRATHRKPEEADIRFQVNCGLCFGAKGVQYFCYRTPDPNWEFSETQYAMIKADGTKTDIYDSVRKVNAELAALADEYFSYTYMRTYAVRGRLGKNGAESFDRFYTDGSLPPGMDAFYCSENAVIGAFAKGGAHGYQVVNYTDPSRGASCYIEFSLHGAAECFVTLRGQRQRLAPSYGKFCLLLEAGDGAFIAADTGETL